MSVIPEHYQDILQSTALAHVATIGSRGEPRVSPLLFDWDGTHILFGMNKASQKYRNLLREPRIALSLVDPTNPYRSLEIRGKVARIDEDLDARFANSLIRKYLNRERNADEIQPGEELVYSPLFSISLRNRNADEIQPGEERVIIVVEPERVNLFPPQEDKREP